MALCPPNLIQYDWVGPESKALLVILMYDHVWQLLFGTTCLKVFVSHAFGLTPQSMSMVLCDLTSLLGP